MKTDDTLDGMIRAKARIEASNTFHKQFKDLFKDGHSGTWTPGFGYTEWEQMRKLATQFLNAVTIPQAEQKAVNEFYTTYQNLLQEFPNLVVEAAQEQQS